MNNHRTSRCRKMALIMLILLLLAAFLIIIKLYMKVKQSQEPASSVRLCRSKQCLRSAGDLSMSMNRTVDPCDDFYQYVCGNWMNVHPRSDIDVRNDWFREKLTKVYALVRETLTKNMTNQPKPVDQARDFFASCMDTENVEHDRTKNIFDVLKSVNLPILPTIFNVSEKAHLSIDQFDWLDTVIKVKTQLDMHIFIGFDIRYLNSSEKILLGILETTNEYPRSYASMTKFSNTYQSSSLPIIKDEFIETGLEVEYTITDEENHQIQTSINKNRDLLDSDEYKIIKKYVKESKVSVEVNDYILHQNIIQSLKQYRIFDYEIKMLQSTKNNNVRIINIDSLQAVIDNMVMPLKHPKVPNRPILKTYFDGIFKVSNVTLDYKKDFIVMDITKLKRLITSVLLTPPEVVELYIWIKVVKALDRHTTLERQPRSLQCSMITNELLGMAVSYAIMEPDIFNVSKPKVLDMINEVKYSLHESVSKAEWMDDDTKKASYEKITNIKSLVGIPEWFYEPGKLEEYYEGIEVSRGTYLKNLRNIVQARLRKYLNKFRDSKYFLWAFDPSTVNAAYIPTMNSITVPMVMLQYPFFDLGLDSLNYGNLGVVLGHEITHGFDNKSRLFDKDGNYVQWWSNETIRGYVNLTLCLLHQYSSYYVAETNEYVNGNRTLGENIADNGGLNQALAALKRHLQEYGPEEKLPGFEHMSSEQMFFLSFTHVWCSQPTERLLRLQVNEDPHTPSMFRVRGALQNSEEFARAWNCPLGSPMNPNRERCTIF